MTLRHEQPPEPLLHVAASTSAELSAPLGRHTTMCRSQLHNPVK